MKFCSQCGAQNSDTAIFCQKCGNSFQPAFTPPGPAFTPPGPSFIPPGSSGTPPEPKTSPPLVKKSSSISLSGKNIAVIAGAFIVLLSVVIIVGFFSDRNKPSAPAISNQPADWYADEPGSGTGIKEEPEYLEETEDILEIEGIGETTEPDGFVLPIELQIEDFLAAFLANWARAVNENNFSLVSPYIAFDSDFYSTQASVLSSIHNKGIREAFISVTVHSASFDGIYYTVFSTEVFDITNADGTNRRSFDWTYIIEDDEGFKIRGLY